MAGAALTAPFWERVVGQHRVRTQLVDALRSGRAPHACLLAGPPGVGKAAVALEFAALLVCEQDGPQPCGQCPQCASSRILEHPDLHLVFPVPSTARKSGDGTTSSTDEDPALAVAERVGQLTAALARDPYTPALLPKGKRQKDEPRAKEENKEIRIGQIRALLRLASLKPYMSRRKVFVIFGADTMNSQAQNALLKALEEPAPEAYFLLIAESETALLPTIRSRCQRLRLAPLSRTEIETALIAGGLPEDRAHVAAAVCGGRLVRARELAGSDLQQVQERVIQFLRAAAKCDPEKISKAADDLLRAEDLPSATGLELLGLLLRDVALRRAGRDALADVSFAGAEQTIEAVFGAYPQADYDAAAQAVDQSAQYLDKGYTQDLVLAALAIRLHELLGPLAPSKPKPQTKHA